MRTAGQFNNPLEALEAATIPAKRKDTDYSVCGDGHGAVNYLANVRYRAAIPIIGEILLNNLNFPEKALTSESYHYNKCQVDLISSALSSLGRLGGEEAANALSAWWDALANEPLVKDHWRERFFGA